MDHLMVDIETMGNKSGCAIVSLAAVRFNIDTGTHGEEFYRNISLESCLLAGLTVQADTVMWWLNQSKQARDSLKSDCTHIAKALHDFREFYNNEFIWANSPRFDLEILAAAYGMLNTKIPWDFRKERCCRTLYSYAPDLIKGWKYGGIAHKSLDDCHNQINKCVAIWNHIKK